MQRIRRSKWYEAQKDAVKSAGTLTQIYPTDKIVVATPFNKTAEKIAAQCRQANVKATVVRGHRLGDPRDGVIITTYHQLKGLEFDHVILTGLDDESLPQFWIDVRDESETETEASNFIRRLIYVGMTRARKSVILAGGEPFSRFFDRVPAETIAEL